MSHHLSFQFAPVSLHFSFCHHVGSEGLGTLSESYETFAFHWFNLDFSLAKNARRDLRYARAKFVDESTFYGGYSALSLLTNRFEGYDDGIEKQDEANTVGFLRIKMRGQRRENLGIQAVFRQSDITPV
jgi:hypothetical protein